MYYIFNKDQLNSLSLIVITLNFDSPEGREFFSSLPRLDRLWGPPSLLSKGYWGGKRPERVVDYSSPSSLEAKNVWNFYLYSSIRLHGTVPKHRGKFKSTISRASVQRENMFTELLHFTLSATLHAYFRTW